MKLWLTAQEIAEEALPDLPNTKRGMNKFVARASWKGYPGKARRRPGAQGAGGWEYHVDLLPAWARLAYLRKYVAVADPLPASPPDQVRGRLLQGEEERRLAQAAASGPGAESLSGAATTARDARLALVAMADRFHRGSGLALIASDREFAALFNSGSMPASPWVREAVGSISVRSLSRWRSAAKAGAISALGVDRAAARKGTGILDRAEGGQARAFVLALLVKNPLFTAKHIRAATAQRFGNTLSLPGRTSSSSPLAVALPPLRTFQRQIEIWRVEYRHELTRLTDPDGFKNKVRFVASGSTRAERLNEVWQIDASPADVMTSDGRHSVYVAVDVFSRRMAVLVSRTAKAEAVGLLIRKCLIAWGVPERIKSDNGSDFIARATQRLLASLGVEHELSRPFSPEEKGVVERAIGTLQRDLMRTLPGFIGHSVADRKKIEAKTAFARRLGADAETLFGIDLSAAELQDYADAWAETIYAHAPHAGLKGATPFARAAAFAGPVRRIENTAALDVLLARVPGRDGIRRVTKQGIRIDGVHYLIGTVMPGEDVLCRMDGADLGRLHLFTPDGETFLGHALAPELAGLDPAGTIARVRAEQKALIDGRLTGIRREAKRIGPRDVAAALRSQAADHNAALIAFPKPVEAHSTQAIAAAGDAIAAPAAEPLSERAAAIHEDLKREAAGNVTPLRTEETRQQRFRRALDFEGRIARGEALAQDDALWLGGYRAGPEFRAMRDLYEDFGERALR